jgi:hypothetical protein
MMLSPKRVQFRLDPAQKKTCNVIVKTPVIIRENIMSQQFFSLKYDADTSVLVAFMYPEVATSVAVQGSEVVEISCRDFRQLAESMRMPSAIILNDSDMCDDNNNQKWVLSWKNKRSV